MSTAISVGIVQRGSARASLVSAIVAAAAAFLLVSPVAAQSRDTSTAPTASVAPGPEATTAGTLETLEAAFTAQACDPFLTAAALSSIAGVTVTSASGGRIAPESDRPGFIGLECRWSIDGGDVRLRVAEREWAGKKKPKTSDLGIAGTLHLHVDATELAGPGDVAYSSPGEHDFGEHPGSASLTWALWVKHGKAFADRTLSLVSATLDVAALERLAATVSSDATPGDAPLAVAPADAAAPLVGAWTLSGTDGLVWVEFEVPDSEYAMMTVAFDEAGTVTTTFDCKRPKGANPLALTDRYFVDGDKITMVSAAETPVGKCERSFETVRDEMSRDILLDTLDRASSKYDATWSVVDGDTLTITGTEGDTPFTLTFARASD